MPSLPYLPEGVTSLPAERFVLFADMDNNTLRIDESTILKNGVGFTAHWETPTLNQLREGNEFNLAALELYYASVAASSINILVSGDGGETFSAPIVVPLLITAGRIARVWATFEGLAEATGFDLRARIEMDQDELCIIYAIRPHLKDLGDLIV